jgi:molybdopterin-binding protein
VQQNPYLLRGTVFKNIEIGLKLKKVDKNIRLKKVSQVLKLLGISELSSRNARTLSGGEAQKVAIGQVIILDPDVLILDEPFTHLDKNSIDELEKIILKLKEDLNKTIILTTHNQYQAQWLADDVYSVIKGKVFEYQMLNLFSGGIDVEKNTFNTDKQLIVIVPHNIDHAEHIAIDPKQIVVSRNKLDSSMQNSYKGKITGMVEDNGRVKLSVASKEEFQAIVTYKALKNLDLSIGDGVWISFKSSSILLL